MYVQYRVEFVPIKLDKSRIPTPKIFTCEDLLTTCEDLFTTCEDLFTTCEDLFTTCLLYTSDAADE